MVTASDRPLGPKEISRKAQVKHSTTRVYVRQLLRQGLLKQPFRGAYVTNPMYRVGRPPKVQNLRLRLKRFLSVKIPDYVEQFGAVKIEIRFGTKRRQITASLSCPEGMDLTTFTLAISRFKQVAGAWEGTLPRDEEIEIVTAEFLDDYTGIRLDGITCVTLRSFRGSLERIYNQAAGLRSEVKVTPESIEGIYALLKGGVTHYNVMQGVFAVVKQVEALVAVAKDQNRRMQHLDNLFVELLKRSERRR